MGLQLSKRYYRISFCLPLREVLKSAATTEQLARAAAPATHAMYAASASGGRSGSECVSSDMASAVRDCIGINDSRFAALRHPRSPPSLGVFFFFSSDSPLSEHVQHTRTRENANYSRYLLSLLSSADCDGQFLILNITNWTISTTGLHLKYVCCSPTKCANNVRKGLGTRAVSSLLFCVRIQLPARRPHRAISRLEHNAKIHGFNFINYIHFTL